MFHNAWGKILGAFFGFSLAGPLGALFGILIGTLFDKGLSYSRGTDPSLLRGQTRKVFHSATFSVMGHIAKSDGQVSEDEIELARKAMNEMRLNIQEQKEAIASFTHGKNASFQLNLVLGELKFACREQPALLRMFIEIQYRVVTARGGRVDIRKQRLVNHIFTQLGFVPVFKIFEYRRANEDFYSQYSQYQQYQQQQHQQYQQYQNYTSSHHYVDELAEAYKTLNVSDRSTAAEIKKAYRQQMSKHHPDKLIAKGLSEQQVKEGTVKAQKIQAAYEKIRQSRGF